MELVRTIIGIIMNLEIWLFLSLNILCLYCMKRGRFHLNRENPAYLITTFNLLSETCQLFVHFFYIGPSILLGDFLFPGGQEGLGVTVMATLFLGFWYLGSIIQVLMAVNRLLVVFFPTKKILSYSRLLYIIVGMIIFAWASVTYSQLLSPCCRITPDFHFYSYSYLVFENQTENPSMTFVDIPLDLSTSAICATSYCAMFIYVYGLSADIDKHGDGHTQHMRREIRLCFQFLLMFLAYTVAWTTFFIFPALGITTPEAYMITCVNVVANCGVNGVVYLTMNKEVQFELKKLMGKVYPGAKSSTQDAKANSYREQTVATPAASS